MPDRPNDTSLTLDAQLPRPLAGRRILVCAPVPPEYDREGGAKRIFDIIRMLGELGASVTFVAQNALGAERYIQELQQLGVAVFVGFGAPLQRMVHSAHFDAALLAFWYVGERLTPMIRQQSPQTKILVDTIDVHFLRHARARFGVPAGRLDVPFGAEIVREVNAYAAVDAVLTVSSKEATLVADMTAGRPKTFAVPDIEDIPLSSIPRSQRQGVVFIGNFRHPPNVDALQFLCDQVVPRLPESLLNQHGVQVVGNALHEVRQVTSGRLPAGLRPIGWVPSVTPYLHRASVSILPLRYGAGTKRKLIQAMLAGTPSVTTSVGAEGLGVRHEQEALIADHAHDFAQAIQRLQREHDLWDHLAAAGRQHAMQRHGKAVLRDRLLAALSL